MRQEAALRATAAVLTDPSKTHPELVAYTARTGTKTTLAELRRLGWRLMISARGRLNAHGLPYACDNGAWTAKKEFDAGKRATAEPDLVAFQIMVDRMGPGADFIVAPDIVCGGPRSWAMSRAWLRRLRRNPKLRHVPILIAVQDGMEPDLVERFLGERVGIFIGGSDAWKEATAAQWADLCRRRGALCHMGRVNTARRLRIAEEAGVTSFDGASASLFPKTLPFLERERLKTSLLGEISRRVPAMSPEEFARRAQAIVDTMTGHARHRAMDQLSEQVLEAAGFGHGIRIFEAAVRNWHGEADPYPYPQACPDCEKHGSEKP